MTTWTTSTGQHGENTWITESGRVVQFQDELEFPKNIHDLRKTPQGRKVLVDRGVSMKGYKRGRGDYSDIPFTERRFVSWDGEGDPEETTYFLFGNSDGKVIHAESLSTEAILDFLLKTADKDSIHFGFAFGYDANMALKDLSKNHLRILKDTQTVQWRKWRIHYIPRKWFMVTDRRTGKTVKIWDVWSFFMCSALDAWKQYGIPVSETVIKGKEERGKGYEHLDEVLQYFQEENEAYVKLVTKLRDALHAAGLFISAWHGPGAIASFSLRNHHVQLSMAHVPEEVGLASQFGYGGGRFEMFKVGRANTRVYEYDINSAYPYAISQLPDLAKGTWVHLDKPDSVARFGIYKIRFRVNPLDRRNLLRPMPFLHRDPRGLISFPCVLETWVWSPELWGKRNFPGLEILEGWEFHEYTDNRPFDWLAENYSIRKQYKREGNQAQLALKLQMNSMYGKMAQRVGWNEEKRTSPKWHQLEWAGWVTSYCRSMVFRAALESGSDLVAFETDAVFTTKKLNSLDTGDGLGQWEETVFDDFVYLQSGCRFGLQNGEWEAKYRGFDKGSLTVEQAMDCLSKPPEEWVMHGTTRRFIGFAQALHQDFSRWRKFETDQNRDLRIGGEGKRRHMPRHCRACRESALGSERFHDCSLGIPIPGNPESTRHFLPWRDGVILETQELADEHKHEEIFNEWDAPD